MWWGRLRVARGDPGHRRPARPSGGSDRGKPRWPPACSSATSGCNKGGGRTAKARRTRRGLHGLSGVRLRASGSGSQIPACTRGSEAGAARRGPSAPRHLGARLRAYLAGSGAPCCPSLLRESRRGASWAGRGPRPGCGALPLYGRPAGGRWAARAAARGGGATGPGAPAPPPRPPPTVPGRGRRHRRVF